MELGHFKLFQAPLLGLVRAKALVLLAPSSTLVVFNDIQVKNLEANIKQTNSPYLWVLDRVMTGRDSCFEEVLDRNPDVKNTLEAKLSVGGKRAIFQASQTIEGQGLDKVLSTSESYQTLCNKLDPTNFSGLFLGTLLTSPSDGGAANYIVYKQEDKQGIACIDNDESLVSPAFIGQKQGIIFPI